MNARVPLRIHIHRHTSLSINLLEVDVNVFIYLWRLRVIWKLCKPARLHSMLPSRMASDENVCSIEDHKLERDLQAR